MSHEAVERLFPEGDARAQAAAELARQNAYFRQLFDNAPFAIVILDNEDRIVEANPHWQALFGYTLDEARGQPIEALIVPEDRRAEGSSLSRRVLEREFVQTETVRVRKDGTPVHVAVLGAPITIHANRIGIYGIYADITARKLAEQALQHEKELAQVTLHAIGDAVVRTDARGIVEYMNPRAERLTGWTDAEARGRPLDEVFHIVHEKTRERMRSPVEECLRREEVIGVANHAVVIARDGTEYAIEDCAAPIRDRAGRIIGAVLVFRDVTERRRIAEEMAYQASHDSLTGLYNRHEFERRLQKLLAEHRTSHRASLLYIDLDQFKVVNDTCGHRAGDELLRQLGRLMSARLHEGDMLARLGGDEFGLLLADCPVSRARGFAERLIADIRAFRFLWNGRLFTVGASVGIVEIGTTDDSVSALLAAADSACYAAKDRGRNRVRVFEHEDDELVRRQEEMNWVSRITHALEENRFELYQQAIVPLGGSHTGGVHREILLRLREPDGSLVLPQSFIPAAERYNLMPTLDRWVIERVFAGVHRHLAREGSECSDVFAINVSGTTLSDERFIAFVREQFVRHAIPPGAICFEITETAAIANLAEASSFIERMRAIGASIALDDFGSGLSSFAYLRKLTVDFLKIDGTFVRGIASDPVNAAMVESINRVGKVMGIRTVAEYVEDEATLARLREIGVDYVQGYGRHRPERWEQRFEHSLGWD